MTKQTGQQVGYVRVSSLFQCSDRQLSNLSLDRIFEDKTTGKNIDRPALKEMLVFVRAGDTVLVHSIDRMARNLTDLKTTVNELNAKGVTIQFIKENLTFSADKTNPMSELLLNMMGAFAEFEVEMIKERQREGIAVAQAAGKPFGRRARLSPEDKATLQERLAAGVSKASIAAELGVSRQTVYNAINEATIAA